MSSNIVEVRKSDLLNILYFIMNKFDFDAFHHSGTASKADLLGGFIDRWINRISESLIFDKLLLADKNYRVVNDYFLYRNPSQKNAPDVLGLIGKDGERTVKFCKYKGDSWEMISNRPAIEVKTFKKNDYLVTVRTDQMEPSKFFVLVEYELRPDYLKTFFSSDLFDQRILQDISVDQSFIEEDKENLVREPYQIESIAEDEVIGHLKLICIIRGRDLMTSSYLAKEGESVRYVREIEEVGNTVRGENWKGSIQRNFKRTQSGLFTKVSKDGLQSLGIYVEKPEDTILIKENKNSIYIYAKEDGVFNGDLLEKGKRYFVGMPGFDRSSGWDEYIAQKNTFSSSKCDATKELIGIFDSFF